MYLESISYPVGQLIQPWKRFYEKYKKQNIKNNDVKSQQFNRHFKFHLLKMISSNSEFNEDRLFQFLSRLSFKIDDWYEICKINKDRLDYSLMDKAVAHMTTISMDKIDEDFDLNIINHRYVCEALIPITGLSKREVLYLADIYKGHINTLDKVIVSELVSIVVSKKQSDENMEKLESFTIRLARKHLSKLSHKQTGFKYSIIQRIKDWFLIENR